jgi:uncharacterized protein (DUF488 family)
MPRRRSADSQAKSSGPRRTVYTAGHSTRTLDELAELLAEPGVSRLADVRRFPASRRHPQFNRGEMERSLAGRGVEYVWLGDSLGGRRSQLVPADASPNGAWKVAAFRNYADAMVTPEFQAGVTMLERLAEERPTVFLCAEKLWWQCHRRLLADVMIVRGWRVVHLLEPGRADEHALSEWARVEGGRLTYPALV